MKSARPLVLVGPMGAGKSTIGRLLAEHWHWPFMDLDAEIERRAGKRIGEIFADDGEAAFRSLESAALAELLHDAPLVLATGGGAVLDPANRQRLREHARVAYLRASVATQLQRLEDDRSRPLLARGDRDAVLRALAAQRGPLYREVAEFEVDTDGLEPHAVAAQLADRASLPSSLQAAQP